MQPYDLPLLPPAVDWRDERFVQRVAEARTQLGELKGYSFGMPNPLLLLSPAMLRESVASSSIENINTTVERVLQLQLFPEREQRQPDKEVLRYRDALLWGYEQMKNMPLSTRLILGIHQHLVPHAPPGYRRTQNSIQNSAAGETLYTPPAASQIDRLMSNWENFLHDKGDGIDPVLKCAVAHYQFEAIHPFLDGNGRTGRMLVTFYLWKEGLLEKPVLYLSSFFKKHRKVYYQRLTDYREENVGKWVEFFLDGVIETAEAAIETVRKITLLREQDMTKIGKMNKTSSESALHVLPRLFAQPIVTVSAMQEWTGFSTRTGAQKLIDRLIEAGILEIKDESKKYGRSYVYRAYLDIFEQE